MLGSLFKTKRLSSYLLELCPTNVIAKSCARQSPYQNFPSANEVELAGVALKTAPTNDNSTFYYIPIILYVFSLAPVPPPTPAKLVAKYTNADL